MSIATQSAIMGVFLVGISAFAIDVGWMQSCKSSLQGAADAAALAGAGNLGSGNAAAIAAAQNIGALNTVAGQSVLIPTAGVKIGDWKNGVWTDKSTGLYVKVEATTTGVPSFFGKILGKASYDVGATAVAGMSTPTKCGIFAQSLFELNGNADVDAFNSTVGTWPAAINHEGGICTNNSAVTLQGNIDIEADVRPGPGGSVTVKGSATMNGSTTPLMAKIFPTAPSLPSTYTKITAKEFKGANTLAAGNYYIPGGFSVNAGATVTTNGKVNIYTDGDVTINGHGFVNTSKNPANLSIYVIGAHSTHNNGDSAFYGGIYAPQSEIELNGNADFFGALIGNYVHINGNLDFHIDTSLDLLEPQAAKGIKLVQ